ncbi:MAG: acyl-CoA desaturase [Gemmataceae bacterium]
MIESLDPQIKIPLLEVINKPAPPVDLDAPVKISFSVRILTFFAIVIPFIGFLASIYLFWGNGISAVDLGLLVGFYIVTALGITVGYHRLFVHRSFETYGWVKFLYGVFGSMAIEGPLFQWSAMHRRHHQHSDKPDDPHTPHHSGGGIKGFIKGFWNAHVGWLFNPDPPQLYRYIKDLRASRTLRVVSATFPIWALISIVLPGVIGGLITMSWYGFFTGMIWGGLVRIFLVHHVTWSVNSACHIWGTRPYKSDDQSTDNFVFGVLAMGEGWHNAHHAFPTSARHGLSWWKIDFSWYTISLMKMLGLAWDIKVPTKEQQQKNLRKTATV